jgi:hypothetical protein
VDSSRVQNSRNSATSLCFLLNMEEIFVD